MVSIDKREHMETLPVSVLLAFGLEFEAAKAGLPIWGNMSSRTSERNR